MTTQEQDYHDYLYNIYDAQDCAESWERIMDSSTTMTTEEIAYHDYRELSTTDEEEADYAIFSSLFDIINEVDHASYETEFNNVGHSIAAKCGRKKNPNND